VRVEANAPTAVKGPKSREREDAPADDAFGAMLASMVRHNDAAARNAQHTRDTTRSDDRASAIRKTEYANTHAVAEPVDSTTTESVDQPDATATTNDVFEGTGTATDGQAAPTDVTTAELPLATSTDDEAPAVTTTVDGFAPEMPNADAIDPSADPALVMARPAGQRTDSDTAPVAPSLEDLRPAAQPIPVAATAQLQANAPAVQTQPAVDGAVHTPTPAAPTTSVAQPAANQVVQAVRTLTNQRDGIHQIQLELTPAELGKVSLEVRFERGQVHMHVRAENPQTVAALQMQLGDLRAELERSGLQAGALDVDGSARRFHEPDANTDEPKDHADDQAGESRYEVPTPSAAVRGISRSSDVLDVRM